MKGVLALEAKYWALHDGLILVTVPTSGRRRLGESTVAGHAHRIASSGPSLKHPLDLFPVPEQVSRVIDVANPVVGRHRLQASGAIGLASLAVPTGLPMFFLMLPATVVDAKSIMPIMHLDT